MTIIHTYTHTTASAAVRGDIGIVSMDHRPDKARLAFFNTLEREPTTLAAKAWRDKPTHKLQRARIFRSAMMEESVKAVVTATRCDTGPVADGAPTAARKHLYASTPPGWPTWRHTLRCRYHRVKSQIYLSAIRQTHAEMLFKLRGNASPTAAFLRWRGEDNQSLQGVQLWCRGDRRPPAAGLRGVPHSASAALHQLRTHWSAGPPSRPRPCGGGRHSHRTLLECVKNF